MVPEHLVWEDREPEPNPYVVEWQVLLDAIRQDTPHNEAHRAAQANFAGLMGRMATHTGQMVTWDQVVNSDFQWVADIDKLTFETEAPIHEGPDGLYPAPKPGMSQEI
jgi:hypothetical protein